MPTKTTARDLAARCGVSITTVNDIISGRKAHLYRASTQQAVLEAAAAMGFRPNAAARAIASGKFNMVALIASAGGQSSGTRSGILTGIEEAADTLGLTVAFARLRDAPVPGLLQLDAVDGCIALPDLRLDELRRFSPNIPLVHANYAFETDSVYPDEVGAARRATAMLMAADAKVVAYADFGTNPHFSSADRRDGYLGAMQMAGLTPLLEVGSTGASDDWGARARSLLQRLPRPAAVLCYGQNTALVLMRAGYELGWKLPDDLRLMTFCGAEIADLYHLPLAALHVPQVEMGRAALHLLAERMREPGRPLPSVRVPYDPAWDMISAGLRPLLRPSA